MFKLSQSIDLSGSRLYLSFTSAGYSANFASSLLINNNSFDRIGYLFTEFISPSVSYDESSGNILFNGQVYYNESSKIVLINFIAGIPHHSRNKFSAQLVELIQKYSFSDIVIFSGISKDLVNSEELHNKNVDVYYMSNSENFDANKFSLRSFVDLIKMENKTKNLEEMKFIEKCGFSKHLCKYLNKRKINFLYIFAFSCDLFDPLAGLAIYYKLCLIAGFRNDAVRLDKNYADINLVLNSIEKELAIDASWRLFLKE